MKVSTTQFSLEPVVDSHEFWRRIERLLSQAKIDHSRVILLPEYFTLSWLLNEVKQEKFRDNLLAANQPLVEFHLRMQKWADELDLVIIAGTVPVVREEKIVNRCHIYRPHQEILHQDKIKMTRFENEEWRVQGGAFALTTFDIDGMLCAVTTCYDVEFPAVTSLAAEKGVEVLFVPSCTDDLHGYWRVRLCSQARTVENQCYVVMSSIVGGDPSRPEIDVHYGQGGIYTPSDVGMPAGGVLKLGELNIEGVITADLNKKSLEELRRNGTVLNLRDSK